jgi:hypothetical protein
LKDHTIIIFTAGLKVAVLRDVNDKNIEPDVDALHAEINDLRAENEMLKNKGKRK